MLVLTLFGVAVLFVAQEAHFLAAVQVIVYAGAIVVLFLFVIMLLGVDQSEDVAHRAAPGPAPAGRRRRRCCVLAAVLLLARTDVGVRAPVGRRPAAAATGRNVEKLARSLFTRYLLAFEITSVLLVIAVVGAVVLARRPRDARPASRSADGGGDDVRVPGAWYLVLAAVLFTIGAVGLLVRRNVLVMFMCVELMLNAVNLTFVTFARMLDDIGGQVVVFFVLVVAAAEVVVGLGIIVSIFRRRAERHRRRHLPPEGLGRPPVIDAVWLIPALPLAGFLILLVAGRRLGDPRAGWLATAMMGGRFVVAVVVFFGLLGEHGEERVFAQDPVHRGSVGRLRRRRRLPGRPAVDHHGPVRHRRRRPHPPVLDRLHARRRALPDVLRLPEPVRLLHAHARAGRQLPAHLPRLGGRGRLLLPPHLLLVRAADGGPAGKKAFVTNRVGDFGFMLAMFLIFATFGSLDYVPVLGEAERRCRRARPPPSPCCSSSARWASRPSSRSTSGCPTPWRAPRRCRP